MSDLFYHVNGIAHISVGHAFLGLAILAGVLLVMLVGLVGDEPDEAESGVFMALLFLAIIGVVGAVVVWCVEHLAIVR